MKLILVSVLALAAFFRAPAQVSLELALEQDQFLPNEPIRLAVKISNTSGQQLHLGTDAACVWSRQRRVKGPLFVRASTG